MGGARRLRNIIDTTWRSELAYGIGLITADGFLRRDDYTVGFVSKELALINLYRKSLGIRKVSRKRPRGGEKEKKYFTLCFKSKQFHTYLRSLGVHPAKSLTIESVSVPDRLFADFLRGFYDGDGTFWTWRDKRWPSSFGYTLGLSSASTLFAGWLKRRLTALYGVKGYIHIGDGAYTIRYAKGDSRRLFDVMYYSDNLLFLTRKYRKIKDAFAFDDSLKQARIAK